VPYLRVSRDQRGYETTVLLHSSHPGETPRILYWYRSAPGVRIGRPALDEDAIRTIEEQHPEIEFDWPHILELGAATIIEAPPRVERRARGESERVRKRSARGRESLPAVVPTQEIASVPPDDEVARSMLESENGDAIAEADEPREPQRVNDMLAELVGRDIATRLRARYAEIEARIHQSAHDDATRAAWQQRAEPLNPDAWVTPEEILRGVSRADELYETLRRELFA
jgi:hypothetical protein